MWANNNKSEYSTLFIVGILLLVLGFVRINKNPRAAIWSDAEGYFSYLPMAFTIQNPHALPIGSANGRLNEKGEYIIKYTCGVAYFQAIPFFIARTVSDVQGVPQSEIYHNNYGIAVGLTAWFFCVWGAWLLYLVLKRIGFGKWVAFLAVIGTVFGTNAFHYTSLEAGMSHIYSFFVFAALLWLSPTFVEKPTWKTALAVGFLVGMTVLIRPTNVFFLLFLLYFAFKNHENQIVFFLKNNYIYLIGILAISLAVQIPQLLYWHEMTGQWIQYSYDGESFLYWKEPKIAAVLFDPQNGLFLYSPLALMMVCGMILGWEKRRAFGWATFALFALITYIFASWWAWWFGGAFGHRSYVEYFAVFSIPLAYFIEYMTKRNKITNTIFYIFFIFLVYYSVKMSYLYTNLPRPWDGADWRWNWEKMAWLWSYLFTFKFD